MVLGWMCLCFALRSVVRLDWGLFLRNFRLIFKFLFSLIFIFLKNLVVFNEQEIGDIPESLKKLGRGIVYCVVK